MPGKNIRVIFGLAELSRKPKNSAKIRLNTKKFAVKIQLITKNFGWAVEPELNIVQFSIDCSNMFSSWLRTSCLVSITKVATWQARISNFWDDFEQLITFNKRSWAWACVKTERLLFEHLVISFDIAHCSNRNTVCLEDLTFSFISQHNYGITCS